MSTRVKICGITRIEDALAAARAGADAIGFVFHKRSPRNVTVELAQAVIRVLPPFVTTVGLFVDADAGRVREVLTGTPLNLLQFHGQEPAEYCRQFRLPYIKAVRMRAGVDLRECEGVYADAAGLLLDAYVADAAGGTGEIFDWGLVPPGLTKPMILGGGLTIGNVREAISRVKPYAVDVSSGVEKEKGVKDAEKITAFVRAVKESL